jgi:hypothetical protein
MLAWIWFAVLTLAGIALAFGCVALEHNTTHEDDGSRVMLFQFASHGALVLALTVSSDVLVEPAYDWLRAALPQHGTSINQITAIALVGLACFAFVFVAPFCVMMAEDARRDTSSASKVAKNVISRARAYRR